MSTTVLDLDKGIAKEIGLWTHSDEEEPTSGVIDIGLEDDDQLSLQFDDTTLFIPLERIRQLILGGQPVSSDTTRIPNSALQWLLGEVGDFKDPKDVAKRPYWWRAEFRKKAGLDT
jgi:hypothetical protein